jgi:hypothetical protein
VLPSFAAKAALKHAPKAMHRLKLCAHRTSVAGRNVINTFGLLFAETTFSRAIV